MEIKFKPFISDQFVALIVESKMVQEQAKALELEPSQLHDLAKNIIITSFQKYKIDINSLINHLKGRERD